MRFNWTTPLVISPHNPATIYLAGNKLWRSLDRGQRWQAISSDLTKQIDRSKIAIMGATGQNVLAANDGVSSYGNATSMMESPIQPGLLAVGTDDGNVEISRDGGVNWINLTSKFNGVPENSWVARLSCHGSIPGECTSPLTDIEPMISTLTFSPAMMVVRRGKPSIVDCRKFPCARCVKI